MRLIIGLGNPGEKYKNTRHNVGFMAIDFLISQKGLSWQTNKKFNAEMCKTENTIYLKPLTYMNNSGQSVRAAMSYYKLLPKKLIIFNEKNSDLSDVLTVIHDDLDIELGKIKESVDSRSAGHNGVQSVINHLKTKNFKRIRIGIKNEKPANIPGAKFVLQKFNQEESEKIRTIIQKLTI